MTSVIYLRDVLDDCDIHGVHEDLEDWECCDGLNAVMSEMSAMCSMIRMTLMAVVPMLALMTGVFLSPCLLSCHCVSVMFHDGLVTVFPIAYIMALDDLDTVIFVITVAP